MSVLRCKCGNQVDTDFDSEAIVYTGNYKRLHSEEVMCLACREKYYDQLERDADQASREPPQ